MDLVILREMQVADLATVSALGIRSKASWDYGQEEMKTFSEELMLDEASLAACRSAMVAELGGEIVGYFTLRAQSDVSVELDHMFVEPAHFGNGIGTRLFARALEIARSLGAEELFLISDPNAEGFYRTMGARRVGEHQSSIANRRIPIMSVAIAEP